jgi:predicted esterase
VLISPDAAKLYDVDVPDAPTAVVLVFHGGNGDSFEPVQDRGLAVLRLIPVAKAIARGRPDVAVLRVQLAIRGWNGSGATALRDADWALDQARTRFPGLPIVLVGHSMGARISVRKATAPGVVGVVALTPWLPPGDPVDGLRGVPIVIIQATRDRICPEPATRPWIARAEAAGADIRKTVLGFAGHSMLRRWHTWHRLTVAGVTTVLTDHAAALG